MTIRPTHFAAPAGFPDLTRFDVLDWKVSQKGWTDAEDRGVLDNVSGSGDPLPPG